MTMTTKAKTAVTAWTADDDGPGGPGGLLVGATPRMRLYNAVSKLVQYEQYECENVLEAYDLAHAAAALEDVILELRMEQRYRLFLSPRPID